MNSWRERLDARLPSLWYRVRFSITQSGFHGGQNRIWIGFSWICPVLSRHKFHSTMSPRSCHGRLARWRRWSACDVGESTPEGLENELWRKWSDGRVGEWGSAHSPTLPTSLYLPHRNFTYVIWRAARDSYLLIFVSFHYICPCDGATGVVGRHPCYWKTFKKRGFIASHPSIRFCVWHELRILL